MAPALAKPIADVDIQEWVEAHYGFVPHPYWISHCREIYLTSLRTKPEYHHPWHDCPTEKRQAIREAFSHFGLLP